MSWVQSPVPEKQKPYNNYDNSNNNNKKLINILEGDKKTFVNDILGV
jgi:hypothetical protein